MKQVLFLYNPQSGKGKIEKDSQAIGEMFRQAGYSIVDLSLIHISEPTRPY